MNYIKIAVGAMAGVMFFSCNKQHSKLENAELLMEERPDSAYSILQGIDEPEKLSGRDYAYYALLMSQAMDKNDVDMSANTLAKQAAIYYKETTDSLRASKACFYTAKVYSSLKNDSEAIRYYLDANDYIRNIDDPKFKFLINNYLGFEYYKKLMYEDAIKTYQEANRYAKIEGHQLKQSFTLSIIGVSYLGLRKYDDAIRMMKQAIEISPASQETNLISLYGNISDAYIGKNMSDSAIYYCDYVKANFSKCPDFIYSNKAKALNKKGDYEEAIKLCYETLDSALDAQRAMSSRLLAQIYSNNKEYSKSNYFYKKFISLNDSISKATDKERLVHMNKLYHFEKLREENLNLLEKNIKRENFVYKILAVVSTVILICISSLLFMYYKRLRQKERIRELQEVITIKEMENRNNKIKVLKAENDLLIKEAQLRQDFYERLNKISIPSLEEETTPKMTEPDWNEFLKNTDAVYENYTLRLKESFPKLSDLDIRLCCLLKMNMSSNSIASIMSVARNSVNKQKSRIAKEKMLLDDTQSLNDFLRMF